MIKAELIRDMVFRDYLAHKAVGRSGIMTLVEKSPMHFKYELDNPEDPTEPMIIGSAFHTLATEKAEFDKRFYVWSGLSKAAKQGKEDYAEALIQAKGRDLITQSKLEEIKKMIYSMNNHPIAKKIVSQKGYIEPTLIYQDQGVTCKARPDFIIPLFEGYAIIVDFKTSNDATKEAFSKSIDNYWYDAQAYMAMTAWSQYSEIPAIYIWLVVEKDAPHAVAIYQASQQNIDIGASKVLKGIEIFSECQKKGQWHGLNGDKMTMPFVNKWTETKWKEENYV